MPVCICLKAEAPIDRVYDLFARWGGCFCYSYFNGVSTGKSYQSQYLNPDTFASNLSLNKHSFAIKRAFGVNLFYKLHKLPYTQLYWALILNSCEPLLNELLSKVNTKLFKTVEDNHLGKYIFLLNIQEPQKSFTQIMQLLMSSNINVFSLWSQWARLISEYMS